MSHNQMLCTEALYFFLFCLRLVAYDGWIGRKARKSKPKEPKEERRAMGSIKVANNKAG
ncbi:hypothetical protein KFK09_011902 [Dendrobium nobile]|uniref:Uncharacterized protein n=1 Tax=Dendrobium nobile TaxID=94219 RepID=A0A8T3BGC2_DENNO|nr:hypothetical protein KFK09_011902 [Dendrobium nobile]